LQIALLQLSFEISEHPKVARTDVQRVGGMANSENRQAYRIVPRAKICRGGRFRLKYASKP
jgi:hypothetical protein